MNTTPELVGLMQREREAAIKAQVQTRLAQCVRACCGSRLDRVLRVLRLRPETC